MIASILDRLGLRRRQAPAIQAPTRTLTRFDAKGSGRAREREKDRSSSDGGDVGMPVFGFPPLSDGGSKNPGGSHHVQSETNNGTDTGSDGASSCGSSCGGD